MYRTFLAALLVSATVAFAGPNATAVVTLDMDQVTAGAQVAVTSADTGQEFTITLTADVLVDVTGLDLVISSPGGVFELVSHTFGPPFTLAMPNVITADAIGITYANFSGTPFNGADVLLSTITLRNHAFYGTDTPLTFSLVDIGSSGAVQDPVTTQAGTVSVDPLMYTITVNTAAGGTVDQSSLSVEHGVESATVTASPDACHTFAGWTTTSGTVTINTPAAATTTVTASDGDATIEATYNTIQYTLTVADDGNAASTTGGGTVDCGVATAISATPNAGYEFVNWTASGNATFDDANAASTNVTLSGDATVTANFALATYTVTVNAATGGSVDNGSLNVQHGVESGTVTATADACYTFSGWSVTSGTVTINSPAALTTTVTATTDAVIQADFTINSYTLTVNDDGNGTTTGGGAVDCGVASAITATPTGGYAFVNWTVTSGTATFDDANAASTNVTVTGGDATVQANFSMNTYTLSIDEDGDGTVDATPTVNHGAATAITAASVTGQTFSNWTVTAGTATIDDANAASTNVTLTSGDATVTANFTADQYTLDIDEDGDGTVDNTQNVDHGVATAISAGTVTGSTFSNWTAVGNATFDDANAASTNVTLTGNATVTANFTVNSYTLTVTAADGGSVSPSGGQSVDHGDSLEVTATAGTDSNFVDWTIVSGSVTIRDDGAVTTWVIVTEDAEIQANFEEAVNVRLLANRTPQTLGMRATASGLVYSIPAGIEGSVVLTVMDMKGGIVARRVQDASVAGFYQMDIRQNLSAGHYLCTMKAGEFTRTLKVLMGN